MHLPIKVVLGDFLDENWKLGLDLSGADEEIRKIIRIRG